LNITYLADLMSRHDNERPLLDVLTHSDSVLFVGSGLSTWSGLPNWSQLLSGLMAACERRNGSTRLARDALARGDLLDAADKLADVMTPLEMAITLQKDLGFAKSRPHEIHRLLTNIGPERFVTTNFDSLIEQQLGLEGRLGEFRTVTNRQVAELADIQKASANRFIFKPHGDLAEAESLVLSSTQYDRILLGSANLVRPVLETLFVSRPILFIGYGLRDPDMMLLLRSLKERYNGNAGEFWAIVADASDELADYWWRQHRIRIVGYTTKQATNQTDHSELIALLKRLSDKLERKVTSLAVSKENTIITNHGLIRYAARLIRPKLAVSFPVQVVFRSWMERARFPARITKFHFSNINDLLAQCADSLILQGPAGSGKSFAISDRLSRAGREILDWCLADDKTLEPPPVPILLDARLYRGDFEALIATTVPASLSLTEVSNTHTIVLIVDSLDEMPAQHLASGQWRPKLDLLVASLRKVSVQFGTRRSDLVADPTLPVFFVSSLDEDIVKGSLAELGRSTDDMTSDLVEALRTPFTLTLGRRLLGSSRDIVSAPALFSKFLSEALKPVTRLGAAPPILDRLSSLASGVLASGYDTLSIEQAALELNEGAGRIAKTPRENRQLVDRLVDAGIFVSEVGSHIRFVHRSITEFLAATFLVDKWRCKEITLGDVLSVRRWDNAAAWASTLLTEPEAELFLREVYMTDRGLAATVARAAEIGKTHVWSTLFELLLIYPPVEDQQHDFIYSVGDWQVPEKVLPELKPLARRNDALGGWAAALLMPRMSEIQIIECIDRLRKGEFDYNFASDFGPALGERIKADSLDYFLQNFEETNFQIKENVAGQQNEAVSYRSGYSMVISGMSKEMRDQLMKWSQRKSTVIRGIICEGIRDINDDPTVQRYIAKQLDRGVPEAVFSLYLGLNFKKGEWRWWIPTCTDRRANKLITALRSGAEPRRWIMELLRCLAQRDGGWSNAVARIARTESDLALRRILRALIPSKTGGSIHRIISRVLKDAKSLAPIEREFFQPLDQFEIKIDEGEVLDALRRDARGVLRLLGDFLFQPSSDRDPIEIKQIQDWIDILHKQFSPDEWVNENSLGTVCGYLAKAMQNKDRKTILLWANQRENPARDFVLGLIVPRISGVTTDQLTAAAAHRMIELYVKGQIESFPSPGEIATERFVTEFVLPYARSMNDDRWEREAVERILFDAGRRHDRRYNPPWQLTDVATI
jgi:hypothetical protein